MWKSDIAIPKLVPVYKASKPDASVFSRQVPNQVLNANTLPLPTSFIGYTFDFTPRYQSILFNSVNASASITAITNFEKTSTELLTGTSQFLVPFNFFPSLDLNPLYVLTATTQNIDVTTQYLLENISSLDAIKFLVNHKDVTSLELRETPASNFKIINYNFLTQSPITKTTNIKVSLTSRLLDSNGNRYSYLNYRTRHTIKPIQVFTHTLESPYDITVVDYLGQQYKRNDRFDQLLTKGFIINNNYLYLITA